MSLTLSSTKYLRKPTALSILHSHSWLNSKISSACDLQFCEQYTTIPQLKQVGRKPDPEKLVQAFLHTYENVNYCKKKI